jgi:hypothetical protein
MKASELKLSGLMFSDLELAGLKLRVKIQELCKTKKTWFESQLISYDRLDGVLGCRAVYLLNCAAQEFASSLFPIGIATVHLRWHLKE